MSKSRTAQFHDQESTFVGPDGREYTVSLMRVTPSMAKQWLSEEVNKRNRKIMPSNVDKLETAIIDAAWKITGDMIRFNCDGTLIDGQHRLQAIKQSGKTVVTFVMHGLPHDIFDCIDIGGKRTVPQILKIHEPDIKYASTVSGMMSLWTAHKRGMAVQRYGDLVRLYDAIELYEKDKKAYTTYAEPASQLGKGIKYISKAQLGYCLMRTGTHKDRAGTSIFWMNLCYGMNKDRGCPSASVRAILMEAKEQRRSVKTRDLIAYCAIAFNAHMAGESLTQEDIMNAYDPKADQPDFDNC